MSHYQQQKSYYSSEYERCSETYGKNIELTNNKEHNFYSGIYAYHASGFYKDFFIIEKSTGQRSCSFSDREFNFIVNNISLVKDFSITQLTFNGYLQVELNDQLVYIGPKGGQYLAVVSMLEKDTSTPIHNVYNGEEFMPCDNNQIWNVNTKINLKPFLKVVDNSLHFRMFEGSNDNKVLLEIHSTEYCPSLLAGEETSSLFVDSSNNGLA